MRNPDICDIWHDFLKGNLTCCSCLLRPSYVGPPISDLTANDNFVRFLYSQELGITEIRTLSALPDFLIKQGGGAFHGNALRTTVRREFPFPEMHCHHILLYNITSKYCKKSGSALRLWKTSNAESVLNKKPRGGPPTTKTKQIISVYYHQKVVDNTILPSYYHTSRSPVEI
jgi:hypothetical protein